jgi:hypothetical protein
LGSGLVLGVASVAGLAFGWVAEWAKARAAHWEELKEVGSVEWWGRAMASELVGN